MATALTIPEAMRGDVKLIRHFGDVWGTFNLYVDDNGTGPSLREVEIFLGCLKDNWKLTSSLDTEEIPWSCSTGQFTLQKNKMYKVSVGTRNLPPMLIAALNGMDLYSYGSGETLLVRQKITVTAADFESSGNGLDLSDASAGGISGLTFDNTKKLISVKRKSDGTWWTNADTASNTDHEFKFQEGATGVIGLDGEPLVVFEDDSYDGEEFVVVLEYYRDLATDEYKLVDDGETFPEKIDMYLSWMVKVETGPNRGKKGSLVAITKNCTRTSDLEIGGDAQDTSNQTLEFNVDFEEEGDVELHFSWLS